MAKTSTKSTVDIIKGPVTGNQYSRDTSIKGSTYSPYSPSNVMNASDLSSPQAGGAFKMPDLKPTASAGLAAGIQSSTDSLKTYLSSLTTQNQELQKNADEGKKGILSIFDKIGKQSGRKADLYKDEGINEMRKGVDEITSLIESRTRSYDKQIEDLEKNPGGRLKSGLEIDVNNLNRNKARELADYSITANSRLRNYETAKSIVDQRVDAETEDLKLRLEGLKFFYTENSEKLTSNQKTLLDRAISEADREYTDTKDLRKEIGDLQLLAAQNGAPTTVVSSIGSAQDLDTAYAALGTYATDPMDRQLKAAQIASANRSNQGGGRIDLFADGEVREISRAGLGGAPQRVQDMFVESPPGFKQAYIVNGFGNSEVTPDILRNNINDWKSSQKKDDLNSAIESLGL